ncbi:hypothetical protein [Methylomonas sp. 11b]|uniref:hypothetical protein n=1 Tax=Methylomonas sp. 11b TaxID=1168169 RepID=UPI00047DBA39|nr:hypothetical protein [Methylomonas sp. 11b]
MAALTTDRAATIQRENERYSFPAAAATKFYKGGIVAINASNVLVKVTAAIGLKVVGIAEEGIDNSAGAAGAVRVPVRRGLFQFVNGESIVLSDIGAAAYANDDQTIFKTATGRSQVGIIRDVDSNGVWVEI